MNSKTLIRFSALDRHILNCLNTQASLTDISNLVFPKANLPQQSLNDYIRKHVKLEMIKQESRGKYNLTNQGKYFLRVLNKL